MSWLRVKKRSAGIGKHVSLGIRAIVTEVEVSVLYTTTWRCKSQYAPKSRTNEMVSAWHNFAPVSAILVSLGNY